MLTGDGCGRDWIWDRDAETAGPEQNLARASAAWDLQLQKLMRDSKFYARKFREAGITKVQLHDLAEVAFTTKEELKRAIDEDPPFGSNICVASEHIKRDSEGGEPIVTNGLAMCVLHHRAFDADVMAVRPDYKVEVRSDVLAEIDGPTLRHALQGLHGEPITLPRHRIERPDPILLEERYERFRAGIPA